MGVYLVWLLVSSLTMTVLYGCYCLLMSRQRQAAFNRGALLAIYIISFFSLTIYRLLELPQAAGEPIKVLAISSASKESVETAKLWMHIAFAIYIAGASVLLIRRLWGQFSMMTIIAKGQRRERDGYVIVTVDDDNLSPFSWRKYIVISRQDIDDNFDMIVAHELSHLKQHHWLDLLIADVAVIVQWFNPVAWMMRDELKDIHEFQADELVVSSGFDARKYQLMLIGKVVGRKVCFVGNNLSHGKLKRRLAMMNSHPSSKVKRLLILAFIPLVAALAVFANNPKCKLFCGRIVDTYNYKPIDSSNSIKIDSDRPAVVIDGVNTDWADLDEIDPSEIQSITVDKRTDTNGVIYVKTK